MPTVRSCSSAESPVSLHDTCSKPLRIGANHVIRAKRKRLSLKRFVHLGRPTEPTVSGRRKAIVRKPRIRCPGCVMDHLVRRRPTWPKLQQAWRHLRSRPLGRRGRILVFRRRRLRRATRIGPGDGGAWLGRVSSRHPPGAGDGEHAAPQPGPEPPAAFPLEQLVPREVVDPPLDLGEAAATPAGW